MTVAEKLKEFVLQEIVSGNLKPGGDVDREQLVEQFARLFGHERIGRGCFRAAVLELCNMRLLESSAGARAKVRIPTQDRLRSEAMSRLAIETPCVGELAGIGMAASRMRAIALLVEHHEEMVRLKDCTTEPSGIYQFVRADWQFHVEICKASGMEHLEPVVTSTFWTFVLACQPAWSQSDTVKQVAADVCREHQFLMQSIIRGDQKSASAAIRCHLMEALDRAVGHSGQVGDDLTRETERRFVSIFQKAAPDQWTPSNDLYSALQHEQIRPPLSVTAEGAVMERLLSSMR